MTLLGLALATALAVSGSFVARRTATTARVAQRAAELEPEADRALVIALSNWDTTARGQQPIGVTAIISSVAGTESRTVLWATRLTPNVYWFVAESTTEAKPLRRRRMGMTILVAGGIPGLVPRRAWCELP